MSLAQIATDLREDALTLPGTEFSQPLSHGASVHLRVDIVSDPNEDHMTQVEFHFKVERTGKLPDEDTKEYTAWLAELKTFRAPKYFNVPESVVARMIPGKHKYAAAFIWTELVELEQAPKITKPIPEIVVSPLPASADELEAWARQLGQGVHICGVNVFTGER